MEFEIDAPKASKPKRRRRSNKNERTLPKVGMTEQVGLDEGSFMQAYYDQRRILQVPKEIREALLLGLLFYFIC